MSPANKPNKQPPSPEEIEEKRRAKNEFRRRENEAKRAESFTKARQELHDLLKLAGIQRIVCVDDNYAHNEGETIGDTSESTALTHFSQLDSTNRLSALLVEGSPLQSLNYKEEYPNEVKKEFFLDMWNDADGVQKHRIIQTLSNADGRVVREQEESRQALQDFCGNCEWLEFRCISLQGWLQKEAEIIGEISDKRTIFLFDRDYSQEEDRIDDSILKDRIRDAGFILMNRVCEATKTKPECALCGLVSYTLDSPNERDLWYDTQGQDLRGTQEFDATRCVPIPRACLAVEKNEDGHRFREFVRRIKFTFIAYPLSRLVEEAKVIFKQALQDASDAVKNISIYSLDHLVIQKSKAEGLWEPDTLFRIFGLHYYKKAQQLAHDNSEIPLLLETLRPLSKLMPPADMSVLGGAEHWRLGHMEAYEEAAHINKNHLPLEAGDLFEITNDVGEIVGRWILLNQPCDLMVRSTGERKLKQLTLVKVYIDKPQGDYIEEILYYDASTAGSGYVELPAQITIPAWSLDTCVFRNDGVGEFRLQDSCPSYVSRACAERFRLVQQTLKPLLKEYHETRAEVQDSNLSDEAKSKILRNLLPTFSSSLALSPSIGDDGSTLTLNIRRSGRFLAPKAALLLEKLHRYNSRPAEDVDLGKV